jgi:hypothetical protein
MNVLELAKIKRVTGPRALAREILAIVEQEEHYDQSVWLSGRYFYDDEIVTGYELREILTRNVCGTTACVAGNVVILTLPAKGKYDYRRDVVNLPDGTTEYVQSYAQRQLKITNEEADWLFHSDRSKSEVKDALTLLSKGKSISELVEATVW